MTRKRATGSGAESVGAYARLEETFRRRALVEESIGVLHWDMSVMMPPAGAAARAEQMTALRLASHEILTGPRLGELLDDAESAAADLDPWRQANLREMRRLWRHANAVPDDLVAAHSRAVSQSETAWRQARADSDFTALRPFLERVVALTRRVGEAKAEALGVAVYDALMDEFEPGAESGRVVEMLEEYAVALPELLESVLARQASEPEPERPAGPFPLQAQRLLCRRMAETVGLDFDGARLDESLHPFSAGVPDDSRITTRYNEADFAEALMGVLHECGHAMYERGLPRAWRYQPVGQARGMVLHESQSLLVEMQVSRSRGFFEWAAPVIADAFGGAGPAWSAENLYRLATRVEPGFIRVEADEVTYPAHIVLRTRLEQALIGGDLAVADLPGTWNEGMAELLGIVPPDDRRGCLQDIHWPGGDFGYFPTYTLGAMAAAQLAEAARRGAPEIGEAIRGGDFTPLMTWLRSHVHERGSSLSTDDVLRRATGRPLDAAAFRTHLERRYLAAS